MALEREIVVTGAGVVCPIGLSLEALAESLREGRSGVRPLGLYEDSSLPRAFGGQVAGFDPRRFVRPRKALKVMSREIQLAFAAADMACAEAELKSKPLDPERLGVVFGADLIPSDLEDLAPTYSGCMADAGFEPKRWGRVAIEEMFPLWMLKYLPNMPACHIGIVHDARGPNNSLTLGDVSALSAMCEAVRVIERDAADAMITGGCGSWINPTNYLRMRTFEVSRRSESPAAACRPFDAGRDGMVPGEGAGALVIERHDAAEARGAVVLARVLGFGTGFEPHRSRGALRGTAIQQAIRSALADAGLEPGEIGHVNANGLSTRADDLIEAQAIAQTLGPVPVTAPKSYFGNLGPGSGMVELIVSLPALRDGVIAPTLNYQWPDPDCPVNVVHGEPCRAQKPTALVLSHSTFGQAVAVVLGAPED